jgi:hypothetical protein
VVTLDPLMVRPSQLLQPWNSASDTNTKQRKRANAKCYETINLSKRTIMSIFSVDGPSRPLQLWGEPPVMKLAPSMVLHGHYSRGGSLRWRR